MDYKRQITQVALSWGLLLTLMVATRPASLPVVLLIVPFILSFWGLISLWKLFSALGARYMGMENTQKTTRLGIIVCFSVTLLLILQSLGQLTFRDSVTVIALAILGHLYIARAQPRRTKK